MRSRQPPPLDLTGEEIASSNTTLNTLLGGRQKSWMTGAGGTVRPTPRDPMRQRSTLSVLPSPAPSSEPSPVFQDPAPEESNPPENQPNAPQQIQGQPAISQNIRGQPQQPNMQTQNSNPPSSVPLPEVQQTNASRTQRNRYTLTSTISLQSRIQLIDNHVRAHGGWEKLSIETEGPRLRLLQEACVDEDYFFVALHQVFCVWTIDPPRVTKIDGFRDIPLISNAFQLVTKLFRPNDGISRVHLQWLADFPSPLYDLVARSDYYRQNLAAVSICLTKMTENKGPLLQQCVQRGYPPLVDEMVDSLGFISPILQAVFFTASRRTLGIPDDEIGARMEGLFRQDRDGHRALASRYSSSFPPSEKEITDRNRGIADSYLAVRSGQQGPVSSGGSNQTSVTASLNPFSRSPTVQQFGSGVGVPQNPMIGALRAVPPSPVVQQFNSGLSAPPPQNGITAPLRTVPPSPVVQQFNSGFSAPLQATDISREPQDPNHQSIQISQANSAIEHIPTNGQVYSNGQTVTNGETSHELPLYQFPSSLVDPSQYRQQLPSNATRNPVAILRNNHNSSQPNRSMPNYQSGAVVSSQGQPNLSQQQVNPVLQQNAARRVIHFQRQTPQHIVLQRHNGAVAMEQSMPNPPRTHGGLTVLTQGSVSGTQPLATPSPTTAVIFNSITPGQSSERKSPPLIPLNGQSLPLHAPNPEINAIHHSYLRSPYLLPRDMPSGLAEEAPARRYYQAVKEFAVGPVMLPHQLTLSIWEFQVSDINYANIAKDRRLGATSAQIIREVKRGSLQYRMRCVLTKQDEVNRAADCAIADTSWPTSIFMEVNGVTMDVRRKLLHGKDLPVDITRLALDKIKNQVKISVPRPRKQPREHNYIFAVEVVEILQHQQILDMCLQRQRIPAQQTIDSITHSLSGSFVDDDDISMVVGDLTINLADPFMARIFNIPARGSSCLHRECFDLETFLLTRNSKPKVLHQISMVDVWKCPLCGRDARPHSLRVDDFLISVRKSLAQQNLLDTHAIVVTADGSWKPKLEELSTKRRASQAGLDDADNSEEELEYKLKAPPLNKFKDTEIIVLDDD